MQPALWPELKWLNKIVGADVHGVGGHHERGAFGDSEALDHHALVSLPAATSANGGKQGDSKMQGSLWPLSTQAHVKIFFFFFLCINVSTWQNRSNTTNRGCLCGC